MAIDRHMRFASATEFERALQHEKKVLPPKKELKRRKSRRLVGVLAAAIVVAVGTGLFLNSYQKNIEAETLPDCQLVMWLPLPEDESAAAAKQQAFAEIIQTFNESFPNVEIDLQAVPSETQLPVPLPNLFESAGPPPGGAADLRGFVRDLDKKLYHFTDQFPGGQLPLGFVAPVIYVNTTLAQPDDIDAAEAGAMAGTDAQAQFFAGEAKAYFAGTAEFGAVQSALPARYAVVPVDAAQAQASFSDLWSIGVCDKDQQKAAQRLLAFLLSDNAQDILHIRHRSGAVPVNRQAVRVFSAVYSDFEGFFENIDQYTF